MTSLHAGRDGLAAMISRYNALARHLAELVDEAPDLELMAPVELSVVCFRYVPLGMNLSDEELDALNKGIMEAMQTGGKAFLPQAVLHGRFVLRANVLHYGTNEEDVAALVLVVRRVGEKLGAALRSR